MQKRRSPWPALLFVLGLLLLIGLVSAVTIIRREGLEGLFNRKRAAVKRVAPDALPLLDKVEEQIRGK
ncbi:MAG: hypothetical protein M3R13_03870 [Armatimonadota bacterium]|nr:hypothetical protein [Armatimonadota bacterium]